MPPSILASFINRLPPQIAGPLRRFRRSSPLGQRWTERLLDRARYEPVVLSRGLAAGLQFDARGIALPASIAEAEPHVQAALSRLVEPGAVVFDVGANVGYMTLIAARLAGPSGRILSFEPLPEMAAAVRANAAANGFGTVTVRQVAVSDRSGEAHLELVGDAPRSRLEGIGDAGDATGTLVVQTVCLDDVVFGEGHPAPDFVKIDVEGAEVAVLEGMIEILRQHRPTVLCETHGTGPDVEAFFSRVGYETLPVTSSAATPAGTETAHVLSTPARA